MAHMWRSEDNLWGSVFSFHHVRSGVFGRQLWWRAPLLTEPSPQPSFLCLKLRSKQLRRQEHQAENWTPGKHGFMSAD